MNDCNCNFLAAANQRIRLLNDDVHNAVELNASLSRQVKELEAKAEMDYAIIAGDNALITGLKEELTAANNQIRELKSALLDVQESVINWIADNEKQISETEDALTAERAISDKLEKALHEISLCSQNSASNKHECGQLARAVLAEAEAMRET